MRETTNEGSSHPADEVFESMRPGSKQATYLLDTPGNGANPLGLGYCAPSPMTFLIQPAQERNRSEQIVEIEVVEFIRNIQAAWWDVSHETELPSPAHKPDNSHFIIGCHDAFYSTEIESALA
ncbi:hypothetical protein [Paraburkholderia caffeinilytica]|uniref:Uncharacterized protein n=1 Tax=Paraburkholderia caffeinilytica TaxID=1761016 RepID=A0ABQ1M608_9BURK|nr:hypothetical protein [Paraburkholderia caffeinilytica]GGC35547.1 hypothetical protein GCM10011400_22740 [Paraburkholderia caffeinilytica]